MITYFPFFILKFTPSNQAIKKILVKKRNAMLLLQWIINALFCDKSLIKSFADLPKEIICTTYDLHPPYCTVALIKKTCKFCDNRVNFTHTCDVLYYFTCVLFVFFFNFVSQQKVICYDGHSEQWNLYHVCTYADQD